MSKKEDFQVLTEALSVLPHSKNHHRLGKYCGVETGEEVKDRQGHSEGSVLFGREPASKEDID
ncbi:hypothetical protein Thermus77412_10820 [Thermus antranikianii]